MKSLTPVFLHAIRLMLACIVILGLMMVSSTHPAGAATLTVTTNNDSGAGSLRQAVLDAGGGDTITFNPSLSGQTISLTSQITLDKNLTLDGSGLTYQVQVISSGSMRLFTVDSGFTVVIDRLYMGNSSSASGGAIYNEGILTVSNSTFAGSSATGSGGAIYNAGSLTILNSTFSGNIAGGFGGAIYADASSVSDISNSTFWDNHAYFGGGLYTSSTSFATVINSTFAGNTATSLIGAAVYNDGSLNLINSLLSSNSGDHECVNTGSMFSNHNLIGDGTCSAYRTLFAYLYALADNGGPTMTMAIGTSSTARDAGDPAYCENADQRGVNRPAVCDIGAP